jgi:hypothetical protein
MRRKCCLQLAAFRRLPRHRLQSPKPIMRSGHGHESARPLSCRCGCNACASMPLAASPGPVLDLHEGAGLRSVCATRGTSETHACAQVTAASCKRGKACASERHHTQDDQASGRPRPCMSAHPHALVDIPEPAAPPPCRSSWRAAGCARRPAGPQRVDCASTARGSLKPSAHAIRLQLQQLRRHREELQGLAPHTHTNGRTSESCASACYLHICRPGPVRR